MGILERSVGLGRSGVSCGFRESKAVSGGFRGFQRVP